MNILYTLSGFGFGHAVRSRVVIETLRKWGHFVKIATYGQGVAYLKRFFPDEIVEIKGLKHYFLKDRLFGLGTFLRGIQSTPSILLKNLPILRKIIKNFNIDVIFNDFEPTSRWLARIVDLPLVTIDNQFLSHLCKLDIPLKFLTEYFTINSLINLLYPWGDWRFIVSFNPKLTPVKKRYSPNTFVVPPILRKEIFELKPKKEDFILVYQTAPIYKKKLFKIFRNLKEKFICYNLGKPSITRNIILKNFSEEELKKHNGGIIVCPINTSKIIEDVGCGVRRFIILKQYDLPSPFSHDMLLTGYSDIVLMEDKKALLKSLYDEVISRVRASGIILSEN